MTSSGIKPYLWMLAGCVWFSAMTLLARAAAEYPCDWPVVAVARSTVATIAALGFAFAFRAKLVYFRPLTLWWRSLAGSASMVCTFYALGKMSGTDVLTLTNTFPSWIAILSWPMVGERPSFGVWVAVVISILGVGIVAQSQAGVHDSGFTFISVSAALAAAFFTAVAMLGLNRLKGINPLAVVVHFSAVATVVCLMSAFVVNETTPLEIKPTPMLILILVGIGVTAAVGQVFLTLAYRSGVATKISVVGLTQVVMVMIGEILLMGKSFNWVTGVGTLFVLGPTAWLMMHERRPPLAPDETEVPEVAID